MLSVLIRNYLKRDKTSETELFLGTVAVTASKIGSSISRDFGNLNLENYENIAKFNFVEGTSQSDSFTAFSDYNRVMDRVNAALRFLVDLDEMTLYKEKQLGNAYMRFVQQIKLPMEDGASDMDVKEKQRILRA